MNLGLGCWAFGGGYWRDQERQDSVKAIHAALRGEIRHFDTAQGYGKGRSEQLLGQQVRRFSKEVPRENLLLATKIFLPSSPQDVPDLLDLSLRRLCTTYVDILYIHWPDSKKDCRPYLEQMSIMQKQGLVKAIGVSNFPEHLVRQACSVAKVDYCQIPLSLIWIRSLRALAPVCEQEGIRIVTYSPLGSGLLSGRYRNVEDLAAADPRRNLFPLRDPYQKSYLRLMESLESEARSMGTDMGTLALAWVLSHPVDTVLAGARSREQVERALMSLQVSCSEQTLDTLDAVARELDDVVGDGEDNPFFHRW